MPPYFTYMCIGLYACVVTQISQTRCGFWSHINLFLDRLKVNSSCLSVVSINIHAVSGDLDLFSAKWHFLLISRFHCLFYLWENRSRYQNNISERLLGEWVYVVLTISGKFPENVLKLSGKFTESSPRKLSKVESFLNAVFHQWSIN